MHFVRQCLCQPQQEAGEPAGARACPWPAAVFSPLPPALGTAFFLTILCWDAAGKASPVLAARPLPGV